MCMYINVGAKIRRVFRRITCWKVVEWDNEHCEWNGVFYKTDSYAEGKILKSDRSISVFGGRVTHGLHTYVDESCASKLLERMLNTKISSKKFCLVKCRIPMFSRYIEGTGEDGARCYVSERLKVVKFV